MLYLEILPFRKGTSLDYILIEVPQFLHFLHFYVTYFNVLFSTHN
jgi:hypothetical protein